MAQFPYRVDYRFAPAWLCVGVHPGRDGVTLTQDGRLLATFGLLRLDTALSNVEDAHITGPYRWWSAVGPRLSFADDGLTFGTNHERGVCIHFRDRVRRVIGFRDHSALTVTVADPDGLVAALTAAGGRPDRAVVPRDARGAMPCPRAVTVVPSVVLQRDRGRCRRCRGGTA